MRIRVYSLWICIPGASFCGLGRKITRKIFHACRRNKVEAPECSVRECMCVCACVYATIFYPRAVCWKLVLSIITRGALLTLAKSERERQNFQ